MTLGLELPIQIYYPGYDTSIPPDQLGVAFTRWVTTFHIAHPHLPRDVDTVLVPVEESVHYAILGARADREWLSLAEPSFGYVRLGPKDRVFVVTMFHELHCLRMLNRAFSKLPGATVGHIKHCLNYIRQGILCQPDLTLEPGNFEDRDFSVERIGGTHTCRDWTELYDAVEDTWAEWNRYKSTHHMS